MMIHVFIHVSAVAREGRALHGCEMRILSNASVYFLHMLKKCTLDNNIYLGEFSYESILHLLGIPVVQW